MFRSFMVVMLLAGITTAARADDFDAHWKAVIDGVATCWNFGKSHDDGTVTYPEPYRAVCNQLADLQARMVKLLLLATLLLLGACVRPDITVCGQPGSCVINACDRADACKAEPLQVKGALP